MKLITCACGDNVALSLVWRECVCGRSGGRYRKDGDRAVVAGPCRLIGVSNRVITGQRVEAWPYNEGNGKITRYPTIEAARDSAELTHGAYVDDLIARVRS